MIGVEYGRVSVGPDRDHFQQIDDAGAKYREIHQDEHQQAGAEHQCRVVRCRVGGAHDAVDHPWLPPDLGGHPAGQHGDDPCGTHRHREAQEEALLVKLPAPAKPCAADAQQQHQHAQADHDAKGPEDDCRIRAILRGKVVESFDLAIPRVGQDQAAHTWDLDRVQGLLLRHVGQAEQDQRLALAGLGPTSRLPLPRSSPAGISAC